MYGVIKPNVRVHASDKAVLIVWRFVSSIVQVMKSRDFEADVNTGACICCCLLRRLQGKHLICNTIQYQMNNAFSQ
jgi:hypothetical protein